MKAGLLRHSIQIQAGTRTTDTGGGASVSWATIANGTVWADIRPVSSAESFSGGELDEYVSHKITMRYMSGITIAHTALFGTRRFDIRSIINVQERNETLILLCQERKAGS